MKICLYLEFYNFRGGIFYKKIGTGLLSSYRNQEVMLKSLGIDFVERWDDSCDILQINTPWLKSIWLIKKARNRGKKIIIWAHVTAEDIKGVFWFGSLVSPVLKRYLIFAYGLADLVFCPSAYTKSLLIAYGLPEKKLVVQSNGVDLKDFFSDAEERVRARAAFKLRGLVVGTIGLAIPRKGIATFLSLARDFPQIQFIWFGKIYSSLMAKPLPKNLPLNVVFTGFVENIRAAFNSLDIFIFPSHEENQGMAILEAVAAVAFLAWTQASTFVAGSAAASILAAVALVGGIVANRLRREGWAFIGTAFAIGLAVAALFMHLYPNVMPSSTNTAFSLTVTNASSTDYTLSIMTVVAVIFTPLVLLYQGWTYWVFRKRVTSERVPEASPVAAPTASN